MSAEFLTFKAHKKEIGDLVHYEFTTLLDALISNDVIAWADRQSDDLTGLGYGTRTKMANLLDRVGTKVHYNKYDFRSTLAKEPSHNHLVKKLGEFTYCK